MVKNGLGSVPGYNCVWFYLFYYFVCVHWLKFLLFFGLKFFIFFKLIYLLRHTGKSWSPFVSFFSIISAHLGAMANYS